MSPGLEALFWIIFWLLIAIGAAVNEWRERKKRNRSAWRGILKDYKPRDDQRDSISRFRRIHSKGT